MGPRRYNLGKVWLEKHGPTVVCPTLHACYTVGVTLRCLKDSYLFICLGGVLIVACGI